MYIAIISNLTNWIRDENTEKPSHFQLDIENVERHLKALSTKIYIKGEKRGKISSVGHDVVEFHFTRRF